MACCQHSCNQQRSYFFHKVWVFLGKNERVNRPFSLTFTLSLLAREKHHVIGNAVGQGFSSQISRLLAMKRGFSSPNIADIASYWQRLP